MDWLDAMYHRRASVDVGVCSTGFEWVGCPGVSPCWMRASVDVRRRSSSTSGNSWWTAVWPKRTHLLRVWTPGDDRWTCSAADARKHRVHRERVLLFPCTDRRDHCSIDWRAPTTDCKNESDLIAKDRCWPDREEWSSCPPGNIPSSFRFYWSSSYRRADGESTWFRSAVELAESEPNRNKSNLKGRKNAKEVITPCTYTWAREKDALHRYVPLSKATA